MQDATHVLIGIAGGSASGKTLVASRLAKEVGTDDVVVLTQDIYYKDLGHLPVEERKKVNFDHPDAFDVDLMVEHMDQIQRGAVVNVPIYDYKQHNRAAQTHTIRDKKVIILEGILAFYFERLRQLMDIKIFVDTPDDVRLIRRIRRDMETRGRSLESILNQYETMVRPMHQMFCEPTKRFADVVIPEGGRNTIAIDMVKARLGTLIDHIDQSIQRDADAKTRRLNVEIDINEEV